MRRSNVTASKKENNVSKLVSMRLPKTMLADLTERAKEVGLPYQTVMKALLVLALEEWASGEGPTVSELVRAASGYRGGRPAKEPADVEVDDVVPDVPVVEPEPVVPIGPPTPMPTTKKRASSRPPKVEAVPEPTGVDIDADELDRMMAVVGK